VHLLYLSYWGVDDGLTHATVFPHLEVLAGSPKIETLLFVTVERGPAGRFDEGLRQRGIRHLPLPASSFGPRVLSRALDFVALPRAIGRLCRAHAIDRILARGANAGALAHLVQRHVSIPYVVESFEPHAAYMLESRVWRRWDPRYLFLRRWEEAQKREATTLLPVTDRFAAQMRAEGVPDSRVVTLPCTVDSARFAFRTEDRQRVRAQLGIPAEAVVGTYVGKFGGIYYDRDAFDVFRRFAAAIPAFRLLVLTPMDRSGVIALARAAAFPEDRLHVVSVPHRDVPKFLSASDLAFATVRMTPSRSALSLVKVGEYLASGLPIVITEGVGDDSDAIRDHDAGAVIDISEAATAGAIDRICRILSDPGHRARIATLAERYRSRHRVADVYRRIHLVDDAS
jgi:glycosyltransferase involved in cell wall biosynthesis